MQRRPWRASRRPGQCPRHRRGNSDIRIGARMSVDHSQGSLPNIARNRLPRSDPRFSRVTPSTGPG
ncbi:hypothetical protein Q1M64_11705 (plasmid) [Sinorhizobium meliloti]|nr:hypothetical protein Q1M63_13120 [Sinorhizobium meliloti]WKL40429.1 hypothetical protein Q1M64_11705 [Sinorhizobium meliloti]